MKEIVQKIVAITFLLFAATPAWAAEEIEKSNGQKILEGLLPILIIFGLLYFFLRRTTQKNEPYMDRAKVHMDRIEKQNEEIIDLLNEIAGKNRENPEQDN